MSGMTQKDMAALVGYSQRRLQQINDELAENHKLFIKNESGKYDLTTFIRRWVAYNVSLERDCGEFDLDRVRAEHEEIKKQKTQMQVDQMRGDLLCASDVRALWAEIAVSFRNRLMQLGTSVAQQLVMLKDPREIRAIIDREVRSDLEMLAECKLPVAGIGVAENEESEE